MNHAGDRAETALVLIDLIGSFDFSGAAALLPKAEAAAERLARLKARARAAGVPVIFVNDNYGHWNSNFQDTLRRAQQGPGARVAHLLEPEADDYSVLKPCNSGFYATPLELLLRHLGVRRLVVGGVATNICVLYTVHDAHMRGFPVTVVSDGVAAEDDEVGRFALRQMQEVMDAALERAEAVSFD
jgi:nicotinamidase-related amidase